MSDESLEYFTPLPDTQRIDSQTTQLIFEDEDHKIWGRLYPTDQYSLQRLDLMKEVYIVGRSPECDVRITESNVDSSLASVISKIQFKLWKKILENGSYVVYLKDFSMNGTFVNRVKVGKFNEIPLCNGDEISLARAHNRAYVFVDTAQSQSWLPLELKNHFAVIAHLGSGAFGEVKLVMDKKSNQHFAIKKLLKTDMSDKRIVNEIKALQTISHPNLIRLENVFDTGESVCLVLEYVGGGELSKRISSIKKMSEEEAKVIFYQLALAVQYMHKNEIVHRDLKPNNILLSCQGKDGEKLIKITDFGLSKIVTSATDLRSIVGTPMFVAPEILMTNGHGNYTQKVDIWSLGVILYQCLSGVLPFQEKKYNLPLSEQIIRGLYSMRNSSWEGVSQSAASLVRKMLTVDIEKRITIEEILEHPWLNDEKVNKCVLELIKNSTSNDENAVYDQMHPRKRPRYGITTSGFKINISNL